MKLPRRHLQLPGLLMVLVTVAALGASAAPPQQARLLLGIMVDGLDAEYLDLLRDKFGDGGFRMLQERGVKITADYSTPLDATAATAMVFSGAAPSTSGIGADTHFDSRLYRALSTYADGGVLGNFSNNGFSPAALRVTNITDEARIAAGGTNVAYSVASTPGVAISMGGHTANSVLWIDAKSGAWASSTAYSDIPNAIVQRNRTQPLAMRMDTMCWTPSLKPDEYPALPDHMKHYPFRYVFPRSNPWRLDLFLSSPLFNREVTDLAADLMMRQKLGQHEGVTDVLNLAFTVQPVSIGSSADNRVETMDAYVKLDADLQRLFNDIDRRVGLDNAVIMLASTPPRPQRRREDDKWNLPYGEFSPRKATSLLNLYLVALHGNGAYVSHYYNGHIYLNHKLIEERKLDLVSVRAEAARLLAGMTGIDRVHTIDDIVLGRAGEKAEALRRNTVIANSGDLLLEVAPGFEIIDDYENETPLSRTGMVQTSATTTAPVFIFSAEVSPQTLGTPVDARAIAPTVARILRIRSPNAASVPAVILQ